MGADDLIDSTSARRLAHALRHAALQRSVEGLARVVCDHAIELVSADRADCLFFDSDQQILWRADSSVDIPISGMVGEVATQGQPRLADVASLEPTYQRDVDDPRGTGVETIAMEPVLDGHHHVHAVLVLVRDGKRFAPEELALFRIFARRISIVFESVHLDSIVAAEQREAIATASDALFNPLALASHREGKFGDLVEFPPLLPPLAYAAAVLAMIVLVAIGGVARINRYATGPAIVVSPTAVSVASPTDAILERIDVAAGERVVAGQPLAHLNAEVERYDLRRAEQDFEHHLLRRLARPSDADLEASVAEARVALDRAKAKLRERLLVAPRDGIVDDIRLVAGQSVAAGQTVVSLGPVDGHMKLVCAIPASQRPALAPGQVLRFEPAGYPFSYQRVTVASIGNRVFGPTELRAVFGREIGDTISVEGPVVVVEAAMDSRSFVFDGVEYVFHPGMSGRADIRVADDPLLFVLLPFLKRLNLP